MILVITLAIRFVASFVTWVFVYGVSSLFGLHQVIPADAGDHSLAFLIAFVASIAMFLFMRIEVS